MTWNHWILFTISSPTPILYVVLLTGFLFYMFFVVYISYFLLDPVSTWWSCKRETLVVAMIFFNWITLNILDPTESGTILLLWTSFNYFLLLFLKLQGNRESEAAAFHRTRLVLRFAKDSHIWASLNFYSEGRHFRPFIVLEIY